MKTNRFIVAVAVIVATATAQSATIVLHEEAVVSGKQVLLGDVAKIEGDAPDELAGVELSQAPLPGTSKQLSAAMIEARVRNAGLPVEELQVTGARTVRATSLSKQLSKEQIADSLMQHILIEMPWDAAETEVDVPLPLDDVTLAEGEIGIEWRTNPQYRYLGAGAFRGTITVDGEVEKTLLCKANVETYAEVVVAANDLQRGKVVSAGDLQLVKQAVSKLPHGAVWNSDELVGLVLKKTVFAGQVITAQHVEQRQVIKRNQVVPVELRVGTLHMQSRARAMNDARVGDLVVCANLNSKEQFQGVVRADGVVMVE